VLPALTPLKTITCVSFGDSVPTHEAVQPEVRSRQTENPVWPSVLQLPLESQQCYPEGTMVPFRFAGERSVLNPAKGLGVHSVPIPWGGESS